MRPRIPRPHVPSLAFLAAVLVAGIPATSPAQSLNWWRWPMPYPRYNHVAIYDPVRDRMIVEGGTSATERYAGESGETWSLRFDGPPRWQLLGQGGTATSQAEAVYDPLGDRMVMGGGVFDFNPMGYAYVLHLATDTWDYCCTASAPPRNPDNLATFDGLRRRMLVTNYASVYQLDLATDLWSTLSTVGAGPQQPIYSIVHDRGRDRLIVRSLGDPLPPPNVQTQTWQLTLSGTPTWSPLTTSGTPPPYNAGNDLFFDAARDRVLEVGVDGKVWALSMDATPTWTSIAKPPLPPGSHNPQIVYDATRDRLLWFGSSTLNDTWAFRLTDATWYLAEPGSPIPVLMRHSAVAALPWDALVIFGGYSGRTTTLWNTTWRLPMSGGGAFVPVATTGTPPSPRSGQTAIYDSARQRMIVFGGNDGTLRHNDSYALTIGPTPTWSQIFSQNGPPPARELSHAIYDPLRDRMVIFGGSSGATTYQDVLALTLGASPAPSWISLDAGAGLPAIAYSDLVYDSRRDHLILIAEVGSNTRAWCMPADGSATWTEFGGPLAGRGSFAAAYDWAADRVLLHGGVYSTTTAFDQFMQLNPVTGQWTYASVGGTQPFARYEHTLTRDPARERFVVFGGWEQQLPSSGTYNANAPGSVWFAKDPETVLDVGPSAVAVGGRLEFRRVWLAAPDRIAFELAGMSAGSVVVEAFDVAGRRLGAATLGDGARSGAVRLAVPARPGIVAMRARQGAAPAANRRLVVLR
jgi:hypothetical protein